MGLRFRATLALDRLRRWFGVPLRCAPRGSAGRVSPDDSLSFSVGGQDALLCYGRPFARGRHIFGGLIPYDALWRTGANEPTLLYLPFRAHVAGMRVPKGVYSLYTVPSRDRWTLVLNRATRQWGLTRDELGADGKWYPNAYREWIEAAEVGRAEIETRVVPHVEQLTARAEIQDGGTTTLLIEWETVQIRIPIRVASQVLTDWAEGSAAG
ncbi:MAG: DUF2911 domain-containing protein [Gemmatimonadales bacterium]